MQVIPVNWSSHAFSAFAGIVMSCFLAWDNNKSFSCVEYYIYCTQTERQSNNHGTLLYGHSVWDTNYSPVYFLWKDLSCSF